MDNFQIFITWFACINLVAAIFIIGYLNWRWREAISYIDLVVRMHSDNATEMATNFIVMRSLLETIRAESRAKDYRPGLVPEDDSEDIAEATMKEEYLQQNPSYRQLGQLSFLKPEHFDMLRQMDWTLREDLASLLHPEQGKFWSLVGRQGNVVLFGQDLEKLLADAALLFKTSKG